MRFSSPCSIAFITLLVSILFGADEASAEWAEDTFAQLNQDEDIADVAAFAIEGKPRKGFYTNVLIGRTKWKEHFQVQVVLLRCNSKRCKMTRVFVGRGDAKIAVIDLHGAGSALVLNTTGGAKSALATAKMGWPALVIETSESRTETGPSRFGGEVTGIAEDREFSIISLRYRDRKRARIFSSSSRRGPAGMGVSNSHRLVKTKKRVVEIEMESQRLLDNRSACQRPDPVVHRYRYDTDQFSLVTKPPGRGGC